MSFIKKILNKNKKKTLLKKLRKTLKKLIKNNGKLKKTLVKK